jgi:type IV secretion system protein TrbC
LLVYFKTSPIIYLLFLIILIYRGFKIMRFIKGCKKYISRGFCAISAYLFFVQASIASGMDATGMPWETPMQKVMTSISGPVAKILGVIVIVLAGLGLAFGEVGTGVKRLLQVVLGLAIAFSAASIIGTLYMGGSSGVSF